MKNYGFKPDVYQPDQYLQGSGKLPMEVLQPDGNWTAFAPEFEAQRKAFETFNCTGFNTDKCIEMIHRRKFGTSINYSDRFVGVCAGTTSGGNSPHVVAESIRKNGLIPDEMLPFSDDLESVDEYYSFKGADEEKCRKMGKDWLARYAFGHEWVYEPSDLVELPLSKRQELMMEALTSSPLGVSVEAWPEPDAEGIYHLSPGAYPNHWTTTVVRAVPGKYWLARDTYIEDGSPLKKIAWDYNFIFVKRYALSKKTAPTPAPSTSWFIALLNKIKAFLKI